MSKKKIALIVCVGLVLLLIISGSLPPKTVNQFISNYNREIKNATSSRNISVANCSLDNIYNDYGIAKGSIFNGNVIFEGNEYEKSFAVMFIFNETMPSEAIFAMIEAAIAASGEEYNKVCKAMGILSGNQYEIRGEQRAKTHLNGKDYSIVWADDNILLRIEFNK